MLPTGPIWIRHTDYTWLLEYVGAPESARLLSRAQDNWMHHMGRDRAIAAALQLQHDAGLIMSNLQILGQFVTSLSRMSSEVMQLAFANEPFPSAAVQSVAPSHHVRRAAHYMSAMGVWRPPGNQGDPGSLPTSSCNASMMCSDCFRTCQSEQFPLGGRRLCHELIIRRLK